VILQERQQVGHEDAVGKGRRGRLKFAIASGEHIGYSMF
jgi:hypothetical protein